MRKKKKVKIIKTIDIDVSKSVPFSAIRKFNTGATRNVDNNKYDYEGFNSAFVEHRFAEYMHSPRKQKDGTVRDSDNWKKGIPKEVYLKSLTRHNQDLKLLFRGGKPLDPDTGEVCDIQDLLCAIRFNSSGFLHEILKEDK